MQYETRVLWDLMDRQGRSMTWLARASGLSRSYLYRLKNGERPFTERAARRISAAMEMPLGALFLPIASTDSRENRSWKNGSAHQST